MRTQFTLLAASTGLFLAALGARLAWFGDVKPVAEPSSQSIWRFEAAFLLHATEYIAGGAMLIVAATILVTLARRLAKRGGGHKNKN